MDQGRTLFDLIGLGQDLEELLGRKIDVVTEGGLSVLIRHQVLATALISNFDSRIAMSQAHPHASE